jgi:transcriptional regulator with XRE-family HTH domain
MHNDPQTAMSEFLAQFLEGDYTQRELAAQLGVNNGHISRFVRQGAVSPTLRKALVQKGYLEPAPTRTRIAFDVTPELREAIREAAAGTGNTGAEWLAEVFETWCDVTRWVSKVNHER